MSHYYASFAQKTLILDSKVYKFLLNQIRSQTFSSPSSSRIIHTFNNHLPLHCKDDENEVTHHGRIENINHKFRTLNAHEEKKRLPGIDKLPKNNNPNVFGTLSNDSLLRIRLDELSESDDVEVEEFIDNQEEKTRLKTIEYAKLIKTLLREKKLLEALDILDIRMKKERAKPNDYIYRLLISGCAVFGNTKKAFQLFNQMKKRGLPVKGKVYTSLFEACSNSPWQEDGIKRAAGLWDLMIEKKVLLNQPIAHAAIKAFGRCGDIDRAFRIADEMSVRNMDITSETINFLLQACASDKEEGFRHALMIWRKLIDKNIRPTTYTYNLLLRCTRDCSIGDINKFNEDLSVLLTFPQLKQLDVGDQKNICISEDGKSESNLIQEEIVRGNLTPSLISQPPHIGSVIKIGRIGKPWHRLTLLGNQEGFIDTMLKSGAKPDIKTFTQLLFTIPPNKQQEEILMRRMDQLGIKRDLDFCNMLIKKRNMSCNFAGAREVLSIISEEHFTPNIVTFGVLALGCTNLKEIRMLIKDMTSQNMKLNVEIMGTLLNSACRSWDFKAINYLVKLLFKMEIKPNNIFLKHLDNFDQEILRQIENKKQGKGYFQILDNENFEEVVKDFKNTVHYVNAWK